MSRRRSFGELYAVLEIAQSAALAAVEPGVTAEELDRVPRALIEDAGFAKWFIHRTGHGIGIEAHEEPYIVEGNREIVVPGNACLDRARDLPRRALRGAHRGHRRRHRGRLAPVQRL